MNSPLGKYAPIVAAVVAVGVIATFLLSVMFQHPLGLIQADVDRLGQFASLALGAVFGSAVAVNGYKAPLESLHQRVDMIETATGIPTHPPEIVEPVDAE